jgi:CubicO group peptidase (beta-lactamase class C family)
MYFADELWKEDDRDITINNFDVIDLMIEYEPMRYYYPGQRYNYNNTNYSILAAIIEHVSGMSYENYMQKYVFDLIGMTNTEIYNREINPENPFPVIGYNGYRRKAGNTYLNGVVGDKGVYSTVEDLFKFNRALFEYKQLDSTKTKLAYQLAHEELHDHDNYGYGWRVNLRPDSTKIVYHTGWWKGFRSYFIRELNTEKCIIVLTNRSKGGVLSTKELCELFDIESGLD